MIEALVRVLKLATEIMKPCDLPDTKWGAAFLSLTMDLIDQNWTKLNSVTVANGTSSGAY